jgi:SAM-dependent methyltransferase
MNFFDYGLIKSLLQAFRYREPVVEIGSLVVDESMKVFDVRSLLPKKIFYGVDLRHGDGVDIMGDIEGLPFRQHSIGTLLCLDTIEHVWDVHAAFKEIERVLQKDGVAVISSVFNFKIHACPHDFWRFTPEALDGLTTGFPYKILGYQGYRKRPRHVFTVVFGEEYRSQDLKSQIQAFKKLLQRETARDFSVFHRIRHYIAGLFARKPLMDFRYYNNIEIYTNLFDKRYNNLEQNF